VQATEVSFVLRLDIDCRSSVATSLRGPALLVGPTTNGGTTMADSHSPEQTSRPAEPDPSGVQGTSPLNQPEAASIPAERQETTPDLANSPPPPPQQHVFRATFLWRFHRPEVIT